MQSQSNLLMTYLVPAEHLRPGGWFHREIQRVIESSCHKGKRPPRRRKSSLRPPWLGCLSKMSWFNSSGHIIYISFILTPLPCCWATTSAWRKEIKSVIAKISCFMIIVPRRTSDSGAPRVRCIGWFTSRAEGVIADFKILQNIQRHFICSHQTRAR